MGEESLKTKTVKGVAWSSIERFSVQGVQFLVMLIIARVLGPRDYGLIGMLAVFLAVAQTIVDSGFSQALIRKPDRTEVDNNTVFFFNIIVGFFLYILCFILSPYISSFFDEPDLCLLLRVLGGIIVINSIALVQRALFVIDVNFKVQTKATLFGAVVSGIIGITAAYCGQGPWALVYQQLSNSVLITFLLWLFSKWRPKMVFSWESFRQMFGFGSKLLLSALLNTVYNNLHQLVIGKCFNAVNLGYYSRANQFAIVPASSITEVLQRVVYPVLCKIQYNKEKYRDVSMKFLRLSAFFVFPLMCYIAGIAKPLILILLGSKWYYSIYLLPPLCFSMMLLPVHAINLNAITVIGRSDLFLRLEVVKKIVGIVLLVATIPFGILAICYGALVGSILGLFINSYYTGREVGYGIRAQIKDLIPVLYLSLAIFLLAYIICNVIENVWMSLVVATFTDALLFFVSLKVFHFQELVFLKTLKY